MSTPVHIMSADTTALVLSPTTMLAPLHAAVLALSPQEQGAALLSVRNAVSVTKQRLREIDDLLTEQLLAWMGQNGDLVVSEDVRLYPGTKKTTRCNDVRACLEALIDASHGELDQVAGCLASSAWKHGACRIVLDEKWDRHFTETVEADVLTGKPRRVVAESNEFTRKRLAKPPTTAVDAAGGSE